MAEGEKELSGDARTAHHAEDPSVMEAFKPSSQYNAGSHVALHHIALCCVAVLCSYAYGCSQFGVMSICYAYCLHPLPIVFALTLPHVTLTRNNHAIRLV